MWELSVIFLNSEQVICRVILNIIVIWAQAEVGFSYLRIVLQVKFLRYSSYRFQYIIQTNFNICP